MRGGITAHLNLIIIINLSILKDEDSREKTTVLSTRRAFDLQGDFQRVCCGAYLCKKQVFHMYEDQLQSKAKASRRRNST